MGWGRGELMGAAGYRRGGCNAYWEAAVSGNESDQQAVATKGTVKLKHVLSRSLSIQVSGGGECIPHAGLYT